MNRILLINERVSPNNDKFPRRANTGQILHAGTKIQSRLRGMFANCSANFSQFDTCAVENGSSRVLILSNKPKFLRLPINLPPKNRINYISRTPVEHLTATPRGIPIRFELEEISFLPPFFPFQRVIVSSYFLADLISIEAHCAKLCRQNCFLSHREYQTQDSCPRTIVGKCEEKRGGDVHRVEKVTRRRWGIQM